MDGKILNPTTGKWVNKDGKIGKVVIKDITKDDMLFFYSKSAKVMPGKGSNEKVKDASLYEPLGKDFRQVLSNFHMCPFKFEGYTYNTIEHVFQAKKIALVNKEEAFKFTIESGHEIGLGDGAIAQKNRKLVKLDQDTLEKWSAMRSDVMKRAALAKYKTCKEAGKTLKATLGAQLWHVVMRKKPERFVHLEEIRDKL